MSLYQWIAGGVLLVVYGLLVGVTVWAVHSWGKWMGAAKAWEKMAKREPREPALTVVAPEYHAPHAGAMFAKGGRWGAS